MAVDAVAAVDDDVVGRAGRAVDAVAVAVGDVDVVGSGPGDHDRVALPVDEAVVAGAAVEAVVAVAAADEVVAVAADDPVVPAAAVDEVVAVAAVEPVVAAEAVDQVVARAAVDAAADPAGAELVVAAAADDPLTGPQPDHEVDPAGHPHEPRPRDARDLRVAADQRAGIESQQPDCQPIPALRPACASSSTTAAAAPTTTTTANTPTSIRDQRRQANTSIKNLLAGVAVGLAAGAVQLHLVRVRVEAPARRTRVGAAGSGPDGI